MVAVAHSVALAVILSGKRFVDYTFFGFQIAIKTTLNSQLRAQLATLIDSASERETIFDKHAFWTRVNIIVRRFKDDFTFGSWDLVRGERARAEFEEWTSEIENLRTTPSSVQLLPGEHRPHLQATHHVLFTCVFLVQRHSNSDLTLGDMCDLPESNYFTRDTFVLFLGALPELNFASVRSDAIYVAPGPNTVGFSTESLMGLEFEYLQLLR